MRGSKWPATSNQNKVKPKFRGDRVDITTGNNFKIYSGDTLWCKRNNIMFSLCLLLDWCSLLHIRERPYSGEGVRGIPVAWFISIINNGSYGWLDGRASGKELAMLWTHEIDVHVCCCRVAAEFLCTSVAIGRISTCRSCGDLKKLLQFESRLWMQN